MSIGYYTGQTRKARELAVKELGTEKAARMSDDDVTKWIEGNYAIFWGDVEGDYADHGPDTELVALIPNDIFREIGESIVWLER